MRPGSPSPYQAHRSYIAPATRHNALHDLVIGIIAIELLYKASIELLTLAIALISPDSADAFAYGNTATGLLAQLASFALLGFWITLIARLRHRRGFASLTGALPHLLHDLPRAFIAVALVFAISEMIPPYHNAQSIAQIAPLPAWLAMLPLALAALLIQTGAEELLYRGYIQQQVAARWNTPWAWLILPNLLFAAAHWDGTSDLMGNALYMLWAFCFGLAASDLTARSGTLGPAIGFHLANNAYAFLFFAEQGGPDSGLALLLFEPSDVAPGFGTTDDGLWALAPLLPELGAVALIWLAARLAIRR